MSEADLVIGNEEYDEEEIDRRRTLVLNNPHLYLTKKKNLKDAAIIARKKCNPSVLDLCGIRVKQQNSNDKWFFCLMGSCFPNCIPIKLQSNSTNNGCKHLLEKHNIQASKTEAHKRNVMQLNKQIEGADEQFKVDPNRWFEVNIANFACENSLPYRAFQSDTWKIIAKKLPVGKQVGMQRLNIRKVYVEQYIAMKNSIISDIVHAKEMYNLPFISVSLDLIQNEVQNKKMIGVRITYASAGKLVSYNIAVRGYNPTVDEMRMTSASDLLIKWLQIILKEFNIKADRDILTSCTDSGSDVKKALEKVFPTMREWCISHLTHLALADAFGSHVDHNKSKNSDMREFLGKCRKVIEKINKSKVLKALLEHNLLTEFGKVMKLRNSPSHRWAAAEDVFIRLLRCWNQIRNAFMEDGKPFPIADDRPLLLQLRSIIHPIRHIQTIAQKTKEFAVLNVYLLLMEAHFGVLNEKASLNMYDPGLTVNLSGNLEVPDHSNALDRLKPTGVIQAVELDSRATTVRAMLKKAMFERFFKRYHPLHAYRSKVGREAERKHFYFSYLIDMQAALHPALSDGRLLQKVIFSFDDVGIMEKQKHYDRLIDYIWRTIANLAERVACQRDEEAPIAREENMNSPDPQVPKAKKARHSDDPALDLLNTLIAPVGVEANTAEKPSPYQVVKNEIEYYKNIGREKWPKFEETLEWWSSKDIRHHLPCLSQVASALLACRPSSGGLECDFGLLKDVLSPRRASLGQGYVEVEMFLRLNKHLMFTDPAKVPQLPNNKWEEYIPMRPVLPDLDTEDEMNGNAPESNEAVEVENTAEMSEQAENIVTNNDEATATAVSTLSDSEEDSDSLLGGFRADEYGDIYEPTQPPVTESQLSTHQVFDLQETCIPGSLQ